MTAPTFALGDRVTAAVGDELQRVEDGGTWADQRKAWRRFRESTGRYIRADKLDERRAGIIVGRRVLADGVREWIGEEEGYTFHPSRHLTAYLVAYDLRRRPVFVLPGDLTAADA